MEKSVAWNRMEPPRRSEGHRFLNDLHDRLSPSERRYRTLAFEQAHRHIDRAALAGGMPDKKSFPLCPRPDRRRVDVAIEKGIAFIPDDWQRAGGG